MNDREMMELAAKAAGIEIHSWNFVGFAIVRDPMGFAVGWNPLKDDGDAFRLAVALHLLVAMMPEGFTACYRYHGPGRADIPHEADAAAATRRAIVIVAAAIGESMP